MIDLRNVVVLLVVTLLLAGCGTRTPVMRESTQTIIVPILAQHFRWGEPHRAAVFSAQAVGTSERPRVPAGPAEAISGVVAGRSAGRVAPVEPDILSEPAPQVQLTRLDETPSRAPRDARASVLTPIPAERQRPPSVPPQTPTAAPDLPTDGSPVRVRRSDGKGYDVL